MIINLFLHYSEMNNSIDDRIGEVMHVNENRPGVRYQYYRDVPELVCKA